MNESVSYYVTANGNTTGINTLMPGNNKVKGNNVKMKFNGGMVFYFIFLEEEAQDFY